MKIVRNFDELSFITGDKELWDDDFSIVDTTIDPNSKSIGIVVDQLPNEIQQSDEMDDAEDDKDDQKPAAREQPFEDEPNFKRPRLDDNDDDNNADEQEGSGLRMVQTTNRGNATRIRATASNLGGNEQ